ncbi:hypothetical protein [Methylobacillus sp.]|uniref:hypothetical protein n=1 Tax=Methylobacillus sp. TaxID=56818 RepID=UPI002FE021CC
MDKWDIYLQEAKIQAEFAKRTYLAFREAEKESLVFDVFFHLHHFLVHATNIDRILDTKPGSERHTILTGHIDLSDIDLKPFRRLRNHLEHFDERLDRWVRDFEGHAFFDMNIVTGAKGFPEKAFLRALDGNTFKFHGESYNMVDLYDAVLEIDRRLTTA